VPDTTQVQAVPAVPDTTQVQAVPAVPDTTHVQTVVAVPDTTQVQAVAAVPDTTQAPLSRRAKRAALRASSASSASSAQVEKKKHRGPGRHPKRISDRIHDNGHRRAQVKAALHVAGGDGPGLVAALQTELPECRLPTLKAAAVFLDGGLSAKRYRVLRKHFPSLPPYGPMRGALQDLEVDLRPVELGGETVGWAVCAVLDLIKARLLAWLKESPAEADRILETGEPEPLYAKFGVDSFSVQPAKADRLIPIEQYVAVLLLPGLKANSWCNVLPLALTIGVKENAELLR
jgi:hypothetical protein